MQVMGPDKAYLVQHTNNTRVFWADKHELVLGACFKGKTGAVPRQLLDGVNVSLLPCTVTTQQHQHSYQHCTTAGQIYPDSGAGLPSSPDLAPR